MTHTLLPDWIERDGDGTPLVLAFRLWSDPRRVSVDCPFCRRTHQHGLGADGATYGRRVSHCQEKRGEYILIPPKSEVAQNAHLKKGGKYADCNS